MVIKARENSKKVKKIVLKPFLVKFVACCSVSGGGDEQHINP